MLSSNLDPTIGYSYLSTCQDNLSVQSVSILYFLHQSHLFYRPLHLVQAIF